jgi:adenosylcobinamide-GDP ribazoletransferase
MDQPAASAAERPDGVWRREWRLFLTALQFFTRVPVPAWVGWSPEQLNASARHFPTVGCLVGAFSGLVLIVAGALWPPGVAAGLALAAGVWMTGAFHEDGLADSCDGFGGGWEPARILEIMKDSRVGSYATVGVVLVLGLKWQLLALLLQQAPTPSEVLLAMVAAHALSRWAVLLVMARLDYVREDALSKSRPLAQTRPTTAALVLASAVTALPVLCLGWRGLLIGLAALSVHGLAVRFLRRRLGGYVGDALGATQQLAELAVLLALLAPAGPLAGAAGWR